MKETSVSQICKEIELLIKVDHINIVKIFEYYMYTSDIFIVMELLEGGELFDKITSDKKSLTIGVIVNIMSQLLNSLAYLHNQNIGKNLTDSSL